MTGMAGCLMHTLVLGETQGRIRAGWEGPMSGFARDGLPAPRSLVGAFPFDPAEAGCLYALDPAPLAADREMQQTEGLGLTRLPEPAQYGAAVARAVVRLADPADALHKVVLARSLEYETDRPIDPLMVAQRLGADPHVTGYAVPLPRPDAPPAWLVGATPELLLSKRGGAIRSHPLAGSARRSADPTEDAAARAALLASDKDHAEHRYVVEYIHDILAPYCRDLKVPARPGLQCTASMWHLGTEIAGTLRDPDTPCLALLEALHPTPAVAGTPLAPALSVIAEAEAVPRGYYAGTLGWVDGATQDGDWYVTLRCAVIDGHRARLFAGAGIVAASDPEAEIAETRAKFTAMREALGIRADL